jgi:hypothetical protein
MGAGRKLKNHRRAQLWADKSYKKSHLGNEWKKPFAGSSVSGISMCAAVVAVSLIRLSISAAWLATFSLARA